MQTNVDILRNTIMTDFNQASLQFQILCHFWKHKSYLASLGCGHWAVLLVGHTGAFEKHTEHIYLIPFFRITCNALHDLILIISQNLNETTQYK